jgi:hypothetical protein
MIAEQPRPFMREISKEKWLEFFDSFSRDYEGWLVTIEVLDPALGSHIEAADLTLEGISADPKGSIKDAIEIMLGETPDKHHTHIAVRPVRVWLRETPQGAPEAFEIESADGVKTLVRLRPPGGQESPR